MMISFLAIQKKIRHQNIIPPFILFTTWANMVGCQKKLEKVSTVQMSPKEQSLAMGGCEISQEVKNLVNPDGTNRVNESHFCAAVRELPQSESGKLSALVQKLKNAVACAGCSREKKSCFVEMISSRVKKGLTTLDQVKYAHTLKFREVDGHPTVLVRAMGQKPYVDPLQPEQMVLERFANSYLWVFREAAGDLHPGFIWAAIQNSHPLSLEPHTHICYESPTSHMCSRQDYRQSLAIFVELVAKGYLIPVYRREQGSPQNYFGVRDIVNLYLVDESKLPNLEKDQVFAALVGKYSKAGMGPQNVEKIIKLMRKRAQPVLVPNAKGKYELTKDVLDKLKIPVPGVSAAGWQIYFVDHHRITAAYDLAMAIEVYFSRSFISVN